MRIRETYSLYRRTLPGGKTVYYYRVYDDCGKRLCGHSTGQRSKTAAHEFCKSLVKAGTLVPVKRGAAMLFRDFADGFWDFETSAYLKSRKERRPISKSYALQGAYMNRKHLLPVFGSFRLGQISAEDIDKWITGFRDRQYPDKDGETTRQYKGNTANCAFKILRIMLEFAVKEKLIPFNPCAGVDTVSTGDKKRVTILTPEEQRALFPQNWQNVWDDGLYYTLNYLAAITGMRFGELLGLRGEFVFDTHIDVCAQFSRFGYGDVKTHKPKNIPIPKAMYGELNKLKACNGNGYLFSRDGGNRPVGRRGVYNALYKALANIGIDEAARKERNLSMHGWRHFFSTELEMADIPESRAREITGHSSEKSRKPYQHLDSLRMGDVIALQEKLMGG